MKIPKRGDVFMSIRTGKITMTEEFNIIKKIKGESESTAEHYRGLQGYTTGHGDSQFFVMQKAVSQVNQGDAERSAKLVEVSYTDSLTRISGEKTNLQHGNDCTYYNDHYYVVTSNNSIIYEFDETTLKKTGEYSCTGLDFTTVTCIAHISGDFFLLGGGRKLAVCKKTSNAFVKQTSFDLDGDDNDKNHDKHAVVNGIDHLVRQGMYVEDGELFKVYGKRKTNNQITTNYIAKWSLNGSSPKYTGCTLKSMYDYTKDDKFLFEMESVSANSSSMYAAVRIEDNSDSVENSKKQPFKAKLYRISF